MPNPRCRICTTSLHSEIYKFILPRDKNERIIEDKRFRLLRYSWKGAHKDSYHILDSTGIYNLCPKCILEIYGQDEYIEMLSAASERMKARKGN